MNPRELRTLGVGLALAAALAGGAILLAEALDTGFAYAGRLTDGGRPTSGPHDFTFTLYDAEAFGSIVAGPIECMDVMVTNGAFTVPLDFGRDLSNGDPLWLEIAVHPSDGGVAYTTLLPRQCVGATSDAPGVVGEPEGDASNWGLTGNAGTDPNANFLGTTDDRALEIRVDGQRALRIEPQSTSPRWIGGYSGNSVRAGTWGGTVGGGGRNGYLNVVTDDFGTVSGGSGNVAGNDDNHLNNASCATVGGGQNNTAGGGYATVGGGCDNDPSGDYATVAGGCANAASGDYATVAGGRANDATKDYATIGGGRGNTASNNYTTIAGGRANKASSHYATVAGGYVNRATGLYTTVAGGSSNDATGDYATAAGGGANASSGYYAAISGGRGNTANNNYTTIAGGRGNKANTHYATVGGGYVNQATGIYATVGGGQSNKATEDCSTIAGGEDNLADANYATIAGGRANTAAGYYATAAGGRGNTASQNYATVSGGRGNTANGYYATVLGGRENRASGDYSLATGYRAKVDASHDGAMLFADGTNLNFNSAAANEFAARCTGGARFVSAVNGSGTPTAGVTLASGGGSWSTISDRNAKRDFEAVDKRELLDRLARVPIATWRYRTQDASIRHIGPVAQDFHAAFDVGEDDKRIATIDADGVALGAIQGLLEILKEKDARIATLENQITMLNEEVEARFAQLEALVTGLAKNMKGETR